jgi:cytochrome P450
MLMLRHWPRFIAACGRRYGEVFTVRASMVPPMVYLADPAEIKKVFAGDPSVFHAGEANAMLTGLLGANSVLVIDDDVHRDRRRLMLPPFHRDAVASQAELMAEIAAANIAGWQVGQPFSVAPKMSEITLEVILRTVIGASDPARLARRTAEGQARDSRSARRRTHSCPSGPPGARDYSASRLTTPRNTPGTRAATGTIRDRTGRISLACSTAAVSSRYRRDIRRHRRS